MAKTNGAVADIDDDWYDDPSPDLDVEWVHRRAAELGPKFEKLVDAVMREMPHAQRDPVSAWRSIALTGSQHRTRSSPPGFAIGH